MQKLRYKDYQLIARPTVGEVELESSNKMQSRNGLHEVGSVKEFSTCMEERGVLLWWRRAMGYAT